MEWLTPEKYPVFAPRTNVRYGKMTSPGIIEELSRDAHDKHNLPRGSEMYPYQMDGPVWENDKMGFRQYFDGRNCCDVFGKEYLKWCWIQWESVRKDIRQIHTR